MTKIEEIWNKWSKERNGDCFMDIAEFEQAAEELLKPLGAENTYLKNQFDNMKESMGNALFESQGLRGENAELKKQLELKLKFSKPVKATFESEPVDKETQLHDLYAELGKLVFQNTETIYFKDSINHEDALNIRIKFQQIKESEAQDG